MRTFTINKPVSVLFFFLLLLLTPSPSFALSFSLSFSQYRAALYLPHSLATRVADLRTSRGDFEGSARAQTVARKIQSVQGLRFGKLSWNLCWDYVRNYTWRGVTTASFADLASAISDLNEFLRSLNEMSPAESNTERAAWVSGNYNRTFTVSRLLFDKLLNRFQQYRAALYLAHSLATRVADLRASRGDFEGSARAQTIARKIQSVQGLRFGKLSWNLCWDYVRNYTWRGVTTASFADLASAISELNEFLRSLNEMSPAESNTERAAWVSGNYNRTFTVSRLLFDKLLNRFQQGLLWEIIETMQKEVTEGDLFRDCLEVGTNDLKGLIKVLKDISLQYSASASNRNEL